jgi:tetratricopeptide (TPR) repeat protein
MRADPGADQKDQGYDLLTWDSADPAVRRMLARAAYSRDDFDSAAWHYRWLSERYPNDHDLRLRLAWAEKRRGFHKTEAELYRAILEDDPEHVQALAGLATALARMQRLDEAAELLDRLQSVAPIDPATDHALGMMEAMRGHDRSALRHIDRAIAGRGQLSHELRLERRRDLAMDPAFGSLRKDRRMLIVVNRHLGAAGVRLVR